MIGIIDAVLSLGSLLVPPVFQFIREKFLPRSNSASATLSTLATIKPDVIPAFIDGQGKLLEAQTRYFNRDVVGEVSRWVRDLRASIRPIYVIFGITYFFGASYFNWHVDPSIKCTMLVCVNSWFGCRIKK